MTPNNYSLDELSKAIIEGDIDSTPDMIAKLLESGTASEAILNQSMIPAMDEVGRRFEEEIYYLPEMLVSATAMKSGMEILRPHLAESGVEPIAKAALGTVKDDVHDIGKNLVIMMLEGAGFAVEDLGIDVKPERFVQAIEQGAQIVGISALLTTTMENIPDVVAAINQAGVREKVKLLVGGAPVTEDYARSIGVDGYAPDASRAVTIIKSLLGVT